MGRDRGGGDGSSPSRVHLRLRHLGIKPRKGLGQHFLRDSRVLHHILEAAELEPTDTVIEVGPGLGILTRELATRAGRLIAVEIDDALATALAQEMAGFPHVMVVPADILALDVGQLLPLTGQAPEALAFHYKVIANLPYYMASAILRHFLEAPLKPKIMVVMVQKEVAQAMAAPHGNMSLLSVSVQFYARPRIIARVPPRSFYPAPKVHSAVLRLDLYTTPPLPISDTAGFFRLVRAGFAAPRKQLRNALAQGLAISPNQAVVYLNKANVDHRRRAQTLSLEEWGRLWEAYSQATSPVGGDKG